MVIKSDAGWLRPPRVRLRGDVFVAGASTKKSSSEQQPVSFTDLYHTFGDSWRVPSEELLLSQLCGDTKIERAIPKKLFYANDLNPKVYERARKNCTAAGVKEEALLDACTLDTAVLAKDGGQGFCPRQSPARRRAAGLAFQRCPLTCHEVAGMSAIGTKRTSLVALHMSAFGGKADITIAL